MVKEKKRTKDIMTHASIFVAEGESFIIYFCEGLYNIRVCSHIKLRNDLIHERRNLKTKYFYYLGLKNSMKISLGV